MNKMDKMYREEFTLTILDYLSGKELIDPIFVLCNIAITQKASLSDPNLIEVISDIYSIQNQLANGNKDGLSTENIKMELRKMLEKIEVI